MAERASNWTEPVTVADLHLPPTFVADHAVRALAYEGSMTPADIAKRWHVDHAVAAEVVESLKSAGIVELDTAQTTFERSARIRLTASGNIRVAEARRRTWYAGALPVSLADFEQRIDLGTGAPTFLPVDAPLQQLGIAPHLAAEIGQAIRAGATLALQGAAFDEQAQIARTLGQALAGAVTLPFALYAAGSTIRVIDARFHRMSEARSEDALASDVLRSRDSLSRWATVVRPVVELAGGIQTGDVFPAYDDEARFYVAPMPFAACHGLLAVMDSDANPAGLVELAKLWLIPGRYHVGVFVLRSGERIEVPWQAATLLFGPAKQVLPSALRAAVSYAVDIADLRGETLATFLTVRLTDAELPADAIGRVISSMERRGLTTRTAGASVAQYLRDRAAYEGASFSLDESTLDRALDVAASTGEPSDRGDLRAAS
jgi:DNA-binding MarR family transcriptional regulator